MACKLFAAGRPVLRSGVGTRSIVPRGYAMSTGPATSSGSKPPTLVMQIIVRRDLQTEQDWPMGPLMAQAAHAATAVLARYKDTTEVQAYLGDLENMRKVVMEAPNGKALSALAEKLDALEPRIPYHTWVEQPEDVPTALALVPNPRPKALKKAFAELDIGLWK